MALVTLQTVWLNLLADLTQSLTFEFVTGIDPTPITPGEDRQYGSRFRAVTTGLSQRKVVVTATDVPPGDIAVLLAWDAQPVCYRDDSGLKFYGSFRAPAVPRHRYNPDSDVTLTITEVTVSEAV